MSLSDEELAEYVAITLLEAIGESSADSKKCWDRLTPEERKPFTEAARKIKSKILEVR